MDRPPLFGGSTLLHVRVVHVEHALAFGGERQLNRHEQRQSRSGQVPRQERGDFGRDRARDPYGDWLNNLLHGRFVAST